MLTRIITHLRGVTHKEFALLASGVIGFMVPALFALDIYTTNTQANLATWIMILIMDVSGLWIACVEGNKRPFLQIGWVGAASLILFAILMKENAWNWGSVETSSFILCALALLLWRALGKKGVLLGLFLQSVAVYVSFIPQAIDYWKKPDPSTWYLWFWTIVGCVCAIYAAEKRDAPHTFIPWACIVLNTAIFILIMR